MDVSKATIFVSSCLLSKKCLYHGFLATFAKDRLEELRQEGFKIIDACPEMLGGLSCPRPPARLKNGRLVAKGQDVTGSFELGADLALKLVKKEKPVFALLLKSSPACDPGFGVFGKQLSFFCPVIACQRKNDWLYQLDTLLGRALPFQESQ